MVLSGGCERWFCQVVLLGGFVSKFFHEVLSISSLRWFYQVVSSVGFAR